MIDIQTSFLALIFDMRFQTMKIDYKNSKRRRVFFRLPIAPKAQQTPIGATTVSPSNLGIIHSAKSVPGFFSSKEGKPLQKQR